jgi:parvulin-like peptidyl-prolyl isomerase
MRAHDDATAGVDYRPGSNRPESSTSAPGTPNECPPRRHRAGVAPAWAAALHAVLALSCSQLTEPPAHRRPPGEPPAAPAPAPSPATSTLVVADTAPLVPAPSDQIEASHILVSYQGATRAKPTVTRTREQARELAAQLAARAREPGADFAQLAKDASDGPSGVEGGVLPRFGRQQMVKPFSDAAFALRPGEISGVVETNFGFHIIKRLQ